MQKKSQELEPMVTVDQFCKMKLVPIGRTKLYEMMNRGEITFYRVGKKMLLIPSQVYQEIQKKFNVRTRYRV